MTRYLLDADAVIDVLRGFAPSTELINGLYRAGDTLCTCDVIVAEVYGGLHTTHREQAQALLESMRFLVSSPTIARQAGLWRYDFARRGIQLPTTDCLIAAVAHERRATLITGNLADYPMTEVSILPLPRRRRGS